ncbi:RepB family plasmid replication initiator protein [Persicobacter diffluens]
MEKELVKVHNNFTQNAKYQISEAAKNLLYMVLSVYKQENDVNASYFINLNSFSQFTGKKFNYSQFKVLAAEMQGKVKDKHTPMIHVEIPGKKISAFPLFKEISYLEEEGTIEVKLNDVLKPLWDNYTQFTSLNLRHGILLRGKHTKRIFDYVSSLVNFQKAYKKYPQIPIADFKELLGLEPNQYAKYNLFRDKVLDLAVREINEKTDLRVAYEEIRRGRKVLSLKWSISREKVSTEELQPVQAKLEFPTENKKVFDHGGLMFEEDVYRRMNGELTNRQKNKLFELILVAEDEIDLDRNDAGQVSAFVDSVWHQVTG